MSDIDSDLESVNIVKTKQTLAMDDETSSDSSLEIIPDAPLGSLPTVGLEDEDDDFKTEWTDVFTISASYPDGYTNPVRLSGKKHLWKNVEWSTLVVLSAGKVGLFLGLQAGQLKKNALIDTKFQYLLVDQNGNLLEEGKHKPSFGFVCCSCI
jgi:hypothetical protein